MPRQLTYKITQVVGAFIRRPIRRELIRLGVAYTEDKGLLDSQFTITGLNPRQYLLLMDWFNSMADDTEK